MSTPNGAGFTPEQMALAKQLREAYRSSGTLHLQAGAKAPPASRVTSGSNAAHAKAPAPASRPSGHPGGSGAKPQPGAKPSVPSGFSAVPHVGAIRALPASSGRSNSGLVRPLSEQATSPSFSTARTSAMPAAMVMPTAALSGPQTSVTVPAASAPPVGSVRKFPPHILVKAAAAAASSAAPGSSAQAMPNEQDLKAVVQSYREPMAQAAGATQSEMHPVRPLKAPDVVREAININKSGKPVKWNWITEEPEAREVSAEELRMSEPKPEVDPFVNLRMRPALMKAPGVGDRMELDHPVAKPPRKVLGLKASRHA